MTRRPSASEVVMSTAGESGPCSAWHEQVDRDHERVGVLVGDDQHLGRPGEQVDADLAEQLPLRLGDIGVAGARDQIDLADRLGAHREGGDRLHTAEQMDLVGSGEVHGGDRGRRDLPVDGQGRRRDAARRPRPSP